MQFSFRPETVHHRSRPEIPPLPAIPGSLLPELRALFTHQFGHDPTDAELAAFGKRLMAFTTAVVAIAQREYRDGPSS